MKLDNTGLMLVERERSLHEAADEIERELNVRARCFPRWTKEGRMSATDAQDRLDRIASALTILRDMQTKQETPA